jgi:hypothetical protein
MDNRLREEAQPKDVREVLRWCGWLVLVISPVVLCMQTFLFAQCDITAPGKVTCSFPYTKMEKALVLFMGVPRSEFADVAAKVEYKRKKTPSDNITTKGLRCSLSRCILFPSSGGLPPSFI